MIFLMTGGQGCPTNDSSVTHPHCPGQTDVEYMTEFSIWAITASPMIVATDVRNMTEIMNEALLNDEIIHVNQDYTMPAGDIINSQNCDVNVTNACQVWTRALSDGSIAVVFYNAGTATHKFGINFDKLNMGWTSSTIALIRDLWQHINLGYYTGSFDATVLPHGVVFVKMTEST